MTSPPWRTNSGYSKKKKTMSLVARCTNARAYFLRQKYIHTIESDHNGQFNPFMSTTQYYEKHAAEVIVS